MCAPPASTVWHCEHLVLKILAPLVSDMIDKAEGEVKKRGEDRGAAGGEGMVRGGRPGGARGGGR